VDRNTLHILLSNFDLAGVQAAADFNVQRAEQPGRSRMRNGPRAQARRCSQKSVSQRFDLATPVAREFAPPGDYDVPPRVVC
jgi:hypothetical protein